MPAGLSHEDVCEELQAEGAGLKVLLRDQAFMEHLVSSATAASGSLMVPG